MTFAFVSQDARTSHLMFTVGMFLKPKMERWKYSSFQHHDLAGCCGIIRKVITLSKTKQPVNRHAATRQIMPRIQEIVERRAKTKRYCARCWAAYGRLVCCISFVAFSWTSASDIQHTPECRKGRQDLFTRLRKEENCVTQILYTNAFLKTTSREKPRGD